MHEAGALIGAGLLVLAACLVLLRRRRAVVGSTHDPVTGLPPASELERRCRDELARTGKGTLAVMVIDVDRLQQLNADDGRETGDAALRLVAMALALSCRRTDVAVRGAEDELVLVAPQTTAAAASLVAQRFQETLRRLVQERSGGLRRLSACVGIADLDRVTARKPEALIAAAREALSHAKASFRRGGVALAPRLAGEQDPAVIDAA